MKIVWSPQAIHDLSAVHAYISQRDPAAAVATVHRIVSLVEERLPNLPGLGRPGRVKGTRELVVAGTPFIVPYRATSRAIEILRVYHAARRWPPELP